METTRDRPWSYYCKFASQASHWQSISNLCFDIQIPQLWRQCLPDDAGVLKYSRVDWIRSEDAKKAAEKKKKREKSEAAKKKKQSAATSLLSAGV